MGNVSPWSSRCKTGCKWSRSQSIQSSFFYMKNCVKRKFAQNWEPSTLVITYFNVLFDSSPDYCDFKAPGISSSHERLELWGREMGISPPCDCMENLGNSTQTCLSWKINRETLHTL